MRYTTLILILLAGAANADTCLTIKDLQGQAAFSHEDYVIAEDGFDNALRFCYDGEQGKFDNNPGVFHRFGSNTWIWFAATDAAEVTEVWTFDFANRKALFARTRGAGALLPATVGAYVGDIAGTEIE